MGVNALSLQGAIANFQGSNTPIVQRAARLTSIVQNKIPNKYCRLQEAPKVLSLPDTPTKISLKIATITELQPAQTTGTIGKIPDAFTLPFILSLP
jgi:hypothetical protein